MTIELDRAKALRAAGDFSNAAELLTQHRLKANENVTVEHLAIEGECRLAIGDAEGAVALLDLCLKRNPAASTWVRVRYGDALAAIGRSSESAEQYTEAYRRGHSLSGRDRLLAVRSVLKRREPALDTAELDGKIVSNGVICDTLHHVQYLYIPKNACTLLKAIMVQNAGLEEAYFRSGHDVHRFLGTRQQDFAREAGTHAGWFRFVMLRNPFDRLISAYLHKFVRNPVFGGDAPESVQRTIAAAQKHGGIDVDLHRSITFAEFIDYVAAHPDHELDEHWRSQSAFILTRLYDFEHVGRFEDIEPTLRLLERRFGYRTRVEIDDRTRLPHLHRAQYTSDMRIEGDAWRLLPAELAAAGTSHPPPRAFYDDRLITIVGARYAQDIVLYQRAVPSWKPRPA